MKYIIEGNTLFQLLDDLEDIVGLDEHFTFDGGISGYKAICRYAFAIMKECAKWSDQAFPEPFSMSYIMEKVRSIMSYRHKEDDNNE